MNNLVKEELLKNVRLLISEISLSFDYIDKDLINNIENYINIIESNEDEYKKFTSLTLNNLEKYENKLSGALFTTKKLKSNYYDFLNEIILFDKLNFSIFKNESKNTKKSFIQYIYNIYLSCLFLLKFDSVNNKNLSDYMEKIYKNAEKAISNENIKHSTKENIKLKRRNALTPDDILPFQLNMSSGIESQNPLNELMNNKELMNIANDITQSLSEKQINPMNLLTSLLTGEVNGLSSIISDIKDKIEKKVDDGSLDLQELQQKSEKILNSLDFNKK